MKGFICGEKGCQFFDWSVNVGDLVKYYSDRIDIGIVIKKYKENCISKCKVFWFDAGTAHVFSEIDLVKISK